MLTMLPSLCLISSKQTVSLQRRRSDGRAPGRAGPGLSLDLFEVEYQKKTVRLKVKVTIAQEWNGMFGDLD